MPDLRPLRPGDPERIGSYRLVGVLGSGGQGVVYRGVGDDGREVAVKVLRLDHDEDVTKSFLREVEAARRVAAFCTAAVLDAGMADERPYIVSEYVAGDTLQALVQASGPRSGGALDRLAISTLTALAAIHQAGIVHRDFKPGNVLMGPDGPIVIDFGIAKALDATTRTSVPVGTPAYMSPEQFRGERVGPASDVFSWAGTMVFAATGRTPFTGDTLAAVVNRVLSGAPDLTGVPPHLLGVIEACLSKDPSTRPDPTTLLQQLIRQAGPMARIPGPSPATPPATPPAGPSAPGSPSTGPSASTAPPAGPSAPSTPPAGPSAPATPPAGPSAPATPSTGPSAPAAPPHGSVHPAPAGAALPPVAAWAPPAGAVPSGPAPLGTAPPRGVAAQAGPPPGAWSPSGAEPISGSAAFPTEPPAGNAVRTGPDARSGISTGPDARSGISTGPDARSGVLAGAHAGTGPVAGADTETGRGRSVSRRAVFGGAAAAAALAVSAFTVLRPRNDLLPPDDRRTEQPPTESPSPSSTSPSPTPTPTPSAEPFGTQVAASAPLPKADGAVTALAATGSTVVCGTAKGAVFTWGLGQAATRLGDGGATTTDVAVGEAGGTPVLASGHADGRMRLWGLTGQSLASHKASDPVIAVTVTGGGKAVAVSQKYDSMKDLRSVVRLWDLSTGKQIGPAITDHFQGIRGLAFGRLGEDDVLVTGDGGQRVRVWRLSDGRMTHSFRTGEIGGIERLACGEIKGKPVLVSTHLDATLRVYDLATGKRRKKWAFSERSPDDRGTSALVAGQWGDVPIAVVVHGPSNDDVIVRVWNLDDGDTVGALAPGPGGAIPMAALAEQGGHPVVAGLSEDRTLRTWSLGPA
ncbi:protein kinase [Nonomuraea angiospora]|uniref:non-specific serine/threonine protein kinase n=1 Tax=Nonomuraea angiospora TaxID=46172 RepID=A0ABR9LVT7_9ACTN|nr:serine/threonine-protein kinase [Nonomuraea angiospora]MBE1584774.1 serine/threonine protein kinase [Nonomuraea angiospora]